MPPQAAWIFGEVALHHHTIVSTRAPAHLARAFFGEKIAPRLWAGITAMTAACALLTVEPGAGLLLSPGSLLVLAACACWGVENNCTFSISDCDPALIVAVKGMGSGTGVLAVRLLCGGVAA